jgi:acyl-coenzyme A synthetase/AMP-(fatty) acid ligase
MNDLPLLSGTDLDAVLAWRSEGPIRIRDFLADVHALSKELPAGAYLINVCQDRYHFAVGFAAGLLTGKVSLQPSSHSPETLRRIQGDYPGAFCLCDGEFNSIDLPRFDFPELAAGCPEGMLGIPCIPADQCAAILFTSGSTGLPQAHKKTWGKLARNGRAEAESLGLLGRSFSIVATVPVQHSYGFESTFLLALHGGCSFWSGKPFYPQDVITALNAVPQPRLLVTTPFHLATLVAADIEPPAIDMLMSATAPLSTSLASDAENRFAAPLFEIYGSTESGQTACRRTTDTLSWTLLPGVKLTHEDERCVAYGGHVEGRVPLSDAIEILSESQFILHGRHADLINIAGKRTSLAYLNLQICAIPGVADAAFFLPETTESTGVTRLCAAVVAPGLNRQQLLTLLRDRIDSVFLPRPLIFLDALPRNSTGKLTQCDLQAIYEQALANK